MEDKIIRLIKRDGEYIGALVIDQTLEPAPLSEWTIEEVEID